MSQRLILHFSKPLTFVLQSSLSIVSYFDCPTRDHTLNFAVLPILLFAEIFAKGIADRKALDRKERSLTVSRGVGHSKEGAF